MVHSPVSVSRPDLDGVHHRWRDDVLIEKTQLRVRQLARNPIFGEVAGGVGKRGFRKVTVCTCGYEAWIGPGTSFGPLAQTKAFAPILQTFADTF